MSLPRSLSYIDKDQLKTVVQEVLIMFQIKEGVLDIQKKYLNLIIYDLCICALKRRKWFYKNINKQLIQKMMQEVLVKYKFKEKLSDPSSSKDQDLFDKIDELAWKKVHHQEIDEKYYRRLKMQAERKIGLQPRN